MRSHYCGQVSEKLVGQEVTVAGWVHRRRDHGGVIFVDIRDREGLLQVVFDPDNQAQFAEATGCEPRSSSPLFVKNSRPPTIAGAARKMRSSLIPSFP